MKRDTQILLWLCIIAIAVGAVIFFLSPPPAPSGPATAVSVQVLAEGETAAVMTERKNYHITNYAQLADAWRLAYGLGAPGIPDIDFATQEVIAVFGGEKPSGGHDIEVESIVDQGGTRTVTINHLAPGPTCITTQAVTSPFQFVLAPANDFKIARVDKSVTVACD